MCTHREERGKQVLWWATRPGEQAGLEHYARRGLLVPIGWHENTVDGRPYVVYREARSLVQAILDDLEAKGLVYKTGETRPARDGRMQPVYARVKNDSRRS